jgi:hypothetical protein
MAITVVFCMLDINYAGIMDLMFMGVRELAADSRKTSREKTNGIRYDLTHSDAY